MGLLAILYQLVPEAPILIASNRDERFDRPCLPPSIQSGKPRILAGTDQRTGGTWLGVNQHGLFVGATSRARPSNAYHPRSRGSLCRELLRSRSARQAVDTAMEELHTRQYQAVNYVIADSESGWVVHGGQEVEAVELREGLSIVASSDVNDPSDERVALAQRLLTLQNLDSPVKFLAVASKVFARTPSPYPRASMVVRNEDFGTVNSTLISLGARPRDAIYQFADGAPDRCKFEDYSPLLRDILSRGLREARAKANA